MKVVMLASESLPFVKVGGLGDVVYSLSRKLASKQVNVSVVLPFYKMNSIGSLSNIVFLKELNIKMSWRNLKARIYKVVLNRVTYYLVENDDYFKRENVYGYPDDFERFAFLALSSFEIVTKMIKKVDIVHIHDWHCSVVPLLYHHFIKKKEIHFMLTIHNPGFQGFCQRYDLPEYFNLPEYYFDNGLARYHNQVNLLKSAIVLSDRVTTVSPTHQSELIHGISSYGLEYILQTKNSDFVGILNGLDTVEFDPKKDRYIDKNYSIKDVEKGKSINKNLLCKELKFEHPEYPLFCIVSRLSKQKGIEFVISNIEKILQLQLNLVILGKGNKEYENQLSFYCSQHKNVACLIKFSNELAHKIYASSDFLLMPSIYEPCGISQMIAMTYGTIPIASGVGGLADTIKSYNELNSDYANGILFTLNNDHLILCILLAIHLYNDRKETITKLIHNGMNTNFSWSRATEEYLRLYQQIMQKKNALN